MVTPCPVNALPNKLAANVPTDNGRNPPFLLHEKPYFPGTGKSQKAQKDQVNSIFKSTLWLKKDCISHRRKVQNKKFLVAQNKNFSVISKYHLSINFLSQKRPYFPVRKCSKQAIFSNQ